MADSPHSLMPSPQWIPELFDNALEGVSSAVSPELIQPTQIAWGINIINRGSKPATRPSFKRLTTLPAGLVQGVSYFSVQGGMGVASINGRIYRLRINPRDATYEQIILTNGSSGLEDVNSPVIKQVYMQQTVETLVIQDGQSDPIFYNGSTVRRSNVASEVPRGRQMAYGNGRLWVAIGGKNLVAGDIRSNVEGSELAFTETNYLSGGGTLFFPRGITGLAFIATTGTSDYGALMVFGSDYAESVRADVTFRDQWANTPGFVTNVLRHTGCASHWSLTSVNQDLFWRDSAGGIRSIRSALEDESGAGNSPISREVSRLTDYDSSQLLGFCSGISFDNRLLMTSSPRLNMARGITWRDLISLDFAPVSTMRGKTLPAYDGRWTGINFTHLFQGIFGGRSRAFAISHDASGSNSLWEINLDGRGGNTDQGVTCSSGTGVVDPAPITCVVETRRVSFGNVARRKRLNRFDVYLSGIQGEVELKVYWRTDNNQKWLQWDAGISVCAKEGDPEVPGASSHVWKNILPQQRPQLKTFTIPSEIDGITHHSFQNGFEFQIRMVWQGKCRIHKSILWADILDDTDYSLRELVQADCEFNDVSGDDIPYDVPVNACPELSVEGPDDATVILTGRDIFEQYDGPFVFPSLAFQFNGIYYTTQVANGENRVFFDNMMHPMTPAHENGDMPVTQTNAYPKGVYATQWSGFSTYDLMTDSYTGPGIQAVWISSGVVAIRPVRQFGGADITFSGPTFEDVQLQLGASFIGIVSRSMTSFDSGFDSFTRTWFSETPVTEYGGVFVGGASMNYIWVDGYTMEIEYSAPITVEMLGAVVVREGTPARTQTVTDYNQSTNTYSGNKSRVRRSIRVPAGKTTLVADYEFLVTPTVGDPYTLYISKEFSVTPGELFEAITEFPWIPNATVFLVAVNYSFNPSVFQGYVSYESGRDYTSLAGTTTWRGVTQFYSPGSNSDAWDDFDEFGSGLTLDASGNLATLSTGYAWSEQYIFVAYNPLTAYDDFSLYPDGLMDYFGFGYGWVEPGATVQTQYVFVIDDFESYADGSITSLDVSGLFWYSDGIFF